MQSNKEDFTKLYGKGENIQIVALIGKHDFDNDNGKGQGLEPCLLVREVEL